MRIVGIDDGSFKKGVTEKALLVAVLFKGLEIAQVKFTKIIVDGLDATEKAVEALNEWNFEAIVLAGVSFAGFNVINPLILYEKFGSPVIIVARTKPDNKAVKQALFRHFKDWEKRWEIFKKIGPVRQVKVFPDAPPIYIEIVGAKVDWAACLIKSLAVCSRIPEPVRVAKLIARGLS